MNKRHHAQRQHIILSLDALLYQLHTLSFILSPSIWPFVCRLFCQFQCSKPRDLEATASRPLRFFFSIILLFNAPSLWYHTTQGAAEGRAVVLDFVGLAYVPSKTQLLGLDFLIVFLHLVLTTIAYETSIFHGSTESNTQDMLLPIPNSPIFPPTSSPISMSRPPTPLPTSMSVQIKSPPPSSTSLYVVDLRLAPIIARLRNPPPATRTGSSDAHLPLPNTTPWPLPAGMRMLIRASAQMRREGGGGDAGGDGGVESRVPGDLVTRDGRR